MTNQDLLKAQDALQRLSTGYSMPIKTGLKIRAMTRSINHLVEDVREEHTKLIDQYAVKDESGKPVFTNLGNGMVRYDFNGTEPEFNRHYTELMLCEAAGMPAPLKAHELGDINILPVILENLGDLLVDEEQ